MINLGSATITPVVELFDTGKIIQDGIPDATPENAKTISWLAPNYADNDGKLKAQVQAFLVEVGGKKIVVDGCCGDGRERPGLPEWAHLQSGFMERFKQIWQPEDVDIVLCTHMHFDHVGWNTTFVDRKWVPTFPDAQYIFSEREFNYWNSKPEAEMEDDKMGFVESVLPVYEAGLVKLVPDDYQVTKEVSFIPTPGHTPGHVAILIEIDGKSAVISGDALHHPCQIAHPEWGTPWDTDTEQSNKSRRELLERLAGTDTLLIGAHFAEPVAGRIKKNGDSFRLTKALPAIIEEVGFDFSWDEAKVWALDVPVEDMPIGELTWHFDIPFWSKPGGFYDLYPRDVIEYQEENKQEYNRTMKADTSHPIDVMFWRGRWLILDGLHRLVKQALEGRETVKVRKISKSAIPAILKDG